MFEVIEWNSDFKRGYRRALGKMTREKQDEIFYRNAVLRQKIASIIFCLFVIGFWAFITVSDCVCIWYAPLAIPAVIFGLSIFLKDDLLREDEY